VPGKNQRGVVTAAVSRLCCRSNAENAFIWLLIC
jgi:hypothetical protein